MWVLTPEVQLWVDLGRGWLEMDHPSSSSGPSGCWKCQSILCIKISSRAEAVVGKVNLS